MNIPPASENIQTLNDLAHTEDSSQTNLFRDINEVVLLMESHESLLPSSLQLATSILKPSNLNEAIAVVISILMQEVGFILIEPLNFVEKPFTSHYTMLFHHKRTEDIVFSLYMTQMTSILIIKASVTLNNDIKTRFTLQIIPSNHISFDGSSVTYNANSFSNLSRSFRDSVSHPILQSVLKEKGLPELPELSNLLFEVQIKILKLLSLKDLMSMSRVNHKWFSLTKDSYLWRQKYISRFSKPDNMSIEQDWCQLYKNQYLLYKEKRRYCGHHGSHIVWRPPRFDPFDIPISDNILNPPFIIGGRDDLFPRLPSHPNAVLNHMDGDFDMGRLINNSIQQRLFRDLI